MGVTGWGGSVTLFVEADFTKTIPEISGSPVVGTSTQWDTATWDASVWQPDITASWTDITADVRSLSTSAAFSRQTNKYNTARASITLDNRSGDYSPTNTGGVNYQKIGLLRPMRIRARYTDSNGATRGWALFTGLIQSWLEDFPQFGKDSTVTVELLGNDSLLSSYNGAAQSSQGAGETSGARIRRVLANADWPYPQIIDDGMATLVATTLEGNAQSIIESVANAEGGAFYAAPDGSVRFDDFSAQITKAGRADAQVFFSDNPSDARTLTYSALSLSYNGDLVRNLLTYQRDGGVAQQADSAASQQLYGVRSESITGLPNDDDTHVSRLAQRDLAILKDPEHRVEGLTLNLLDSNNADGRLWSALATGAIALRIGAQVDYTPMNQTLLSRRVFIEGITHTITPDRWTTQLAFSSATAFQPYVDSMWGVGAWDSTKWTW